MRPSFFLIFRKSSLKFDQDCPNGFRYVHFFIRDFVFPKVIVSIGMKSCDDMHCIGLQDPGVSQKLHNRISFTSKTWSIFGRRNFNKIFHRYIVHSTIQSILPHLFALNIPAAAAMKSSSRDTFAQNLNWRRKSYARRRLVQSFQCVSRKKQLFLFGCMCMRAFHRLRLSP